MEDPGGQSSNKGGSRCEEKWRCINLTPLGSRREFEGQLRPL